MLSLGELVHCKRLFHVFIEYSPLLLQPNIAGPFDSSEVPLGLDLLPVQCQKSGVFSNGFTFGILGARRRERQVS